MPLGTVPIVPLPFLKGKNKPLFETGALYNAFGYEAEE